MNLALRQLRAITTAYSRAPEFIEGASRDVLCGLLDTIEELVEKACRDDDPAPKSTVNHREEPNDE